MGFFAEYLKAMTDVIGNIEGARLMEGFELITACHKAGGKILLAGNGGSAAIASHVAVDLTKTAGVRAVNFNEADLITCLSNDYGYERWVEKAIDFYADKNDLVILISSSGKSSNILNAAKRARALGLKLMTFSGFDGGNPLRKMGDINFWVGSDSYNVVEMTHHIWLLALVDRIIHMNVNNS